MLPYRIFIFIPEPLSFDDQLQREYEMNLFVVVLYVFFFPKWILAAENNVVSSRGFRSTTRIVSFKIMILKETQGLLFNYFTQCSIDLDCGTDKYCLSSYCAQCIPCESLLNRQPPSSSSCAKTEEDCGICLSGYKMLYCHNVFHYIIVRHREEIHVICNIMCST